MQPPESPTNEDQFPTVYDGIPLLTMDEDGIVPNARLARPSSLRQIFVRFRDDDQTNAMNRASIQLLIDGDTPYEQSELDEAGQPDTTNLNFGGAAEQLEKAMSPYYDLIQSPETLVSVNTLHGAAENRDEWNAGLAEEISRTIREWDQFSFQTLRLCHKFILDGVGVGHWPDELDWRYRGSGLDQFFFPRQTFATEGELEIAVCTEEYTVTRLYAAIKNPEVAKENGWNIPAVNNAIRKATAETPLYQDWGRLVEELKNNDISVSHNTPLIRVVNGWVKEFDGSVSHYITTEDPTGDNEKFLYVSRSKYRSMREALVLFPYGLGTNTKTHGIRGLGYKIYAFEMQRNRSLSRLIDQGNLASSLMLQVDGEESLSNVGLQYFGNTAVIDPNCKVVQYAAPDLQRTVMPVLQEMERLRSQRTSSYSSDGAFQGDQRKTKFEVSAQLQESATLSNTALDFWNNPFSRLLQQVVRRMSRRNYVPQDPGGREIADLHLRLVKRGIPLEALFMLDVKATKLVTGIGAGSASARTLALQRISDLRPRMDDVAQQKLDRALARDAVGAAASEEYFPKDGVKRTTSDTSIAILQNFVLLADQEVPVLPSDYHLAHAEEHIKPLLDMFTAVEQGQMPIEEGAQRMRLLYQHSAEHVEQISGDPASVEKAASLRQMLQQIGEVVSNGLKKAQAAAAKQQEEAAMAEAQGQPMEGPPVEAGPSDKDVAAFEKHKASMQFAQEKHQLKLQQMVEDASTRRAIADADAAAKISRTIT